MTSINLGHPVDMHVHLRQGEMMKLVTPTVKQGGFSVAYVMPNLVPPVTSPERALEYKQELQALAPETEFMVTMYLSPEITPEVVADAAKKGISGIKVYPAGVTTNSDQGVSSYEQYYPVFRAMEEHNLVLNLHGECPSTPQSDITVLNAEERFLPTLGELNKMFPKLRIVLEHCTTKAAVDAVNACDDNVSGSITAHHLSLIIDNWSGNSINFCKPVAKLPSDRDALVAAATSGSPKFFFGSDSAPHPIKNKRTCNNAPAGVFTQSHALTYVAQVFDKAGKLENLKKFVTDHGRKFYQIENTATSGPEVIVLKKEIVIPDLIGPEDDGVVPFRAGEKLDWTIEWN